MTRHDKITDAEVERWRQLSDELLTQAQRLKRSGISSRGEWEATGDLDAAARYLWAAASWVLMEQQRDDR